MLGRIEDVSLFLRSEHTDNPEDLAFVALETIQLHNWTWEDGPDFGFATVTEPDGRRITLVSFDVDYLTMLADFCGEEPQGEDDHVAVPSPKFAFMLNGWPEDWPHSGLVYEKDES